MSSLAVAPILKAMKAALAQPTEVNIFALADVAGLKIKSNLLSVDDIKQLDKTLVLPESATKGDRKRAIKNWLRPFLGKHIKTSDGKVVVVNSADSMWHLSYNGNRNDLKAKVVPYVFDVLTFGEFIEREDLSHERKDDFIAFHVYRKWCEVEGKQVYLEAHAGERENGVIELVVYNQKLAIKKNEGSLGTLKPLNNDQVPKYALDDHNKPVFDDAQVSDDLAVEDGDLVKILEVKDLAVNKEAQAENTASEDELLITKLEKDLIFWDKASYDAKSYNKIIEAIDKIKLIQFLIRFIKNDFHLTFSDYVNSVSVHDKKIRTR